jgi:hypothetical protein
MKEILQNLPDELKFKIKSITSTFETFREGDVGFGTTVVKPVIKIEFYENDLKKQEYVI